MATTSLGSGSEGGSEGGSEKGSEKSTETVAKRKAGWTSSEDEASDWEGSGGKFRGIYGILGYFRGLRDFGLEQSLSLSPDFQDFLVFSVLIEM